MQRKPFWKLLAVGVGYMVLGNVMSTIMTAAASVLANVPFVMIILFIFTLFIFYSLCFTAAFKDGQRERLLVKNHRVEGVIKGRWLIIGLIMLVLMWIPSVLLFIDSIAGLFDGYLIPYRMICGMIYPLALAMGVNYPDASAMEYCDYRGIIHPEAVWFTDRLQTPEIAGMPHFFAFIFMACYILIPVATVIGFKMGFEDKLNPDKVFYEKR